MIQTQDLCFSYTGEDYILKNINLKINKGEFVAILGRNGSGKSTLACQFNGIITPTSGKVFVDGIDTSDEKRIYDVRSKVGVVFQNPDNQIVATIVEEDVAFAPENLGIPQEEIRERVGSALKAVGMYEYRKQAPHMLSGGQKQRVAIAGIIAMQPDCIVLDEPTAMLDPQGRKEVIQTIKKLNKELGKTIIMITHYMDEAVRADRIIVMDKGEVVMNDEPRKIMSQKEKIEALGLETPYVTKLMHSLAQEGINVDTDVLNAEECVDKLISALKGDKN